MRNQEEGPSKFHRVYRRVTALQGLQPRFGDKILRNSVVCPQNGTARLQYHKRVAAPYPSTPLGARDSDENKTTTMVTRSLNHL